MMVTGPLLSKLQAEEAPYKEFLESQLRHNDLALKHVPGKLLGEGESKKTYKLPDHKAILIQKNNGSDFVEELINLRRLEQIGIPVVHVEEFGFHGTKQAIVVKRYPEFFKLRELNSEDGQKFVHHPLVNEKTVADLRTIRDAVVKHRIDIQDLQWALTSTGGIRVWDPMEVNRNYSGGEDNRDLVKTLNENIRAIDAKLRSAAR